MSKSNQFSSDSSSIEQVYQKKTQLQHILLRPDTYVGSTQMQDNKLWVWDRPSSSMVYRQINYVPGLYKIFDELLVNAADNYQRDSSMNKIAVTLDSECNMFSIWNNGKGIPVAIHQQHNMYVPQLIFGHLLTSSNYDDSKKKVTGGRNGYGAKLANVFSKRFIVQTADSQRMKKFSMEWMENMTTHSDPVIRKMNKKENFTCVTVYPDLQKFGMERLDEDIVALLTKRVYDLAGCTGNKVKVFLNQKEIQVKSFQQYMNLYFHRKSVPKMFEKVNNRWEVGISISEGTFQQVSFVNSINTFKGGTHVNHVTDQVINAISGAIQKKFKKLQVKNAQIKQHIWIFVNSLIQNPTFDSQTKQNMTLKQSSFGSKCSLSEKFIKQVITCGIIDQIVAFAKAKTQVQLSKKVKAKKNQKIFVPKLQDANDAGSRSARECTLILTQGDSAKSLAMAGLEIIGRDKYGVFPLKGKLLNIRDASHKQLMNNDQLQNIMKIMGLQPKKEYSDLSELRYGAIMIMADQDLDGSHIKGLVINLVSFYWPSLIRMNGFLWEFITPIIKVFKGSQSIPFFSIKEYQDWENRENRLGWKPKYYKGLGTSTPKECQEYFSDLNKHMIQFQWTDEVIDNDSIDMAFNKKRADDRKTWLANLDPDVYLDHTQKRLPYHQFINKELVQFSNYDNIRSIPSAVDGLKPGQRKIIFACFKRKLKTQIKVAQLAAYVAQHSAYHHGETSLASTIVGLAQKFVGSNNLNLLEPIGQFGTRNMGGKDMASARYIFTSLSEVTRKVFCQSDDLLMDYQVDEGQKVEPFYYVPIIPMVLVNGAEGIGTGWSTNLPSYNPLEIIEVYRQKLNHQETRGLSPWFKGFQGRIVRLDVSKYEMTGVMERIGVEWLKITEIPVKKWTNDYKKHLEEYMRMDNPFITELKEYHTENRVHFQVKIPTLQSISDSDLIKHLKLNGNINLSNVVLFNKHRKIHKYTHVGQIIDEHFQIRWEFYQRRKDLLIKRLTREVEILSSKVRFILEVIAGTLVINNQKKATIVNQLQRKGYPTMTTFDSIFKEPGQSEIESTTQSQSQTGLAVPSKQYDYLLKMPLWSLTFEKVKSLQNQHNQKLDELEVLKNTSIEIMWERDLLELETCINFAWETEESERLNRPRPKKQVSRRPPVKKQAKPRQKKKPPTKIKTASDDEPSSIQRLVSQLGVKLDSDTDFKESSDGASSMQNPFGGIKRKRKEKVGPMKQQKLKMKAVREEDSDYELSS